MIRISTCFLLLILSILFIISCSKKPVVDQGSPLLDSANANFLGTPKINETPGNAMVWGDYLILMGAKRDSLKKQPTSFVWMVDSLGQIVWEKLAPAMTPVDAVTINRAQIFVLLDHQVAGGNWEFVLWKMNGVGEVVQETSYPMPDGTFAKYIEAVSDSQFVVVTWMRQEADTEFTIKDIHVNADGKLIEGGWSVPATKLFPLANGDFFGIRDNASRKEPFTTSILRVNKTGELLWKADNLFDSLKAKIYGVAETENHSILLSAFDGRSYSAILAAYSQDGKKLWMKSPPEMNGYRIYSLAPWSNHHFIIAAQTNVRAGGLSTESWDSFAAFVIDDHGNVLDHDIRSEHWTMTVGGVLPFANNRVCFVGVGSKDPKEFLKQTDIAVYTLTAK